MAWGVLLLVKGRSLCLGMYFLDEVYCRSSGLCTSVCMSGGEGGGGVPLSDIAGGWVPEVGERGVGCLGSWTSWTGGGRGGERL